MNITKMIKEGAKGYLWFLVLGLLIFIPIYVAWVGLFHGSPERAAFVVGVFFGASYIAARVLSWIALVAFIVAFEQLGALARGRKMSAATLEALRQGPEQSERLMAETRKSRAYRIGIMTLFIMVASVWVILLL